jgi:lipid A disaccharide synthetase
MRGVETDNLDVMHLLDSWESLTTIITERAKRLDEKCNMSYVCPNVWF